VCLQTPVAARFDAIWIFQETGVLSLNRQVNSALGEHRAL
jgi:hypothetical protein